MGKFIDMTGWVMSEHGVPDSRLTVIQRAEDYRYANGKMKVRWLVECNCPKHTRFIVCGTDIRTGKIKSCGCYNLDRIVNFNTVNKKKYNTYDLSGEYGVGWTSNTNTEFYFDLKNYDKIKDICWCDYYDNSNIHSIAGWNSELNKTVKMHQHLGFKNYDHIDHNELNNLESNLRQCSSSQNAMNRIVRTDNTTGFIGVYVDKKTNKWFSKINTDIGKDKVVYRGDSKEEAIRARLEAEAQYYGEFAPQRHLFDQYGIEIPEQEEA